MAVKPSMTDSPLTMAYATPPTTTSGMPAMNTATSFCSSPPSATCWILKPSWEMSQAGVRRVNRKRRDMRHRVCLNLLPSRCCLARSSFSLCFSVDVRNGSHTDAGDCTPLWRGEREASPASAAGARSSASFSPASATADARATTLRAPPCCKLSFRRQCSPGVSNTAAAAAVPLAAPLMPCQRARANSCRAPVRSITAVANAMNITPMKYVTTC
mmetsp:Transcript_19941/g.60259  ORF Transcript_19941/g.60259 Transcript_19941/m.60259 type:complete len:215 (-) Transcript_19941:725-1369(-)